MGRFARGMLGASVVLEHRYFGKSIPYEDYSEENLKHLTIKQSVEDLVYFAKTVNLEMPGGREVHPTEVPWIIFGGGYTGMFDRTLPGIRANNFDRRACKLGNATVRSLHSHDGNL